MKVILIHDVKNLGKKNQVLEVSDGYAKNFLFKNKYAVAYTEHAKIVLNKNLESLKEDEDKKIKEAKELKSKIETVCLDFKLKVNKGKVFGEISHKAIIDKLTYEHKIKVDKYMFKNKDKISLGKQTVKITIYKNIEANLKLNVEEEHDKKN